MYPSKIAVTFVTFVTFLFVSATKNTKAANGQPLLFIANACKGLALLHRWTHHATRTLWSGFVFQRRVAECDGIGLFQAVVNALHLGRTLQVGGLFDADAYGRVVGRCGDNRKLGGLHYNVVLAYVNNTVLVGRAGRDGRHVEHLAIGHDGYGRRNRAFDSVFL